MSEKIRIGTAGWSIPKAVAGRFPESGSHVERYAGVLSATEINSSFYRRHEARTYERWAASVPEDFRFSVKLPREITHLRRLKSVRKALKAFLPGPACLGHRLGPLLVQLPPSLAFDAQVAGSFFEALHDLHTGEIVCEPRHASWFRPEAELLLESFRIARVAADPARTPRAEDPGGWRGLVYYRLHGSPRVYHSTYSARFLAALAGKLTGLARKSPIWCIFDNTAAGAATENALELVARLTSNV